jgi:hypothetical protein
VSPRSRLTRLCKALPEVEAQGDQHVGFTVRGKRFAWLLEDHHGDGRVALNCKAPRGDNAALADRDPERYFLPSYLAGRGWVGAWLDVPAVDWDAIERLVMQAYLLTAPKTLGDGVRSRARPAPDSG